MNFYEKVLIIDPELDDNAVKETVEKFKDIIIKQGGEVLKTDNWGRRKLAYELNKHQKGNYFLLLFKAPPSTIAELERLCKVTDTVIKFMVVKLTKKRQIEAALPAPAKPKPAKEEPASTEQGKTAKEGKKDV
ncbi:MAG: 30S ribosomal protein S6 [Nitrospirae bacterium]|nr:30S ribosomal protein S6 [Nitrospirota bacterium]